MPACFAHVPGYVYSKSVTFFRLWAAWKADGSLEDILKRKNKCHPEKVQMFWLGPAWIEDYAIGHGDIYKCCLGWVTSWWKKYTIGYSSFFIIMSLRKVNIFWLGRTWISCNNTWSCWNLNFHGWKFWWKKYECGFSSMEAAAWQYGCNWFSSNPVHHKHAKHIEADCHVV